MRSRRRFVVDSGPDRDCEEHRASGFARRCRGVGSCFGSRARWICRPTGSSPRSSATVPFVVFELRASPSSTAPACTSWRRRAGRTGGGVRLAPPVRSLLLLAGSTSGSGCSTASVRPCRHRWTAPATRADRPRPPSSPGSLTRAGLVLLRHGERSVSTSTWAATSARRCLVERARSRRTRNASSAVTPSSCAIAPLACSMRTRLLSAVCSCSVRTSARRDRALLQQRDRGDVGQALHRRAARPRRGHRIHVRRCSTRR